MGLGCCFWGSFPCLLAVFCEDIIELEAVAVLVLRVEKAVDAGATYTDAVIDLSVSSVLNVTDWPNSLFCFI